MWRWRRCKQPPEESSRYGIFEVPIGVFLPTEVDGFLPAMARGAGVDRAISSSVRVHPPELNGGQVVGVILSLALDQGTRPQDLNPQDVRQMLDSLGAYVDLEDTQ